LLIYCSEELFVICKEICATEACEIQKYLLYTVTQSFSFLFCQRTRSRARKQERARPSPSSLLPPQCRKWHKLLQLKTETRDPSCCELKSPAGA